MDAPQFNSDLHGNAPDNSPVVLVLLDVINDFDFPGGDELFRCALPIAEPLKRLKAEARRHGVPVVYVNDNFGKWRSDFRKLVEHCTSPKAATCDWVEMLKPDEEDYFVLKPKHSGFYGTTLALLLRYLGAQRLILTGLTGDMCVMFTAHDAYLRDLELIIPRDCVASCRDQDNEQALAHMQRVLKADTRPAREIDLVALGKCEKSC